VELTTDVQQLVDMEGIKKLSIAKRRLIIEAIEETIEYHEDDVENCAYGTEDELLIL
jgi:hypothetical protein